MITRSRFEATFLHRNAVLTGRDHHGRGRAADIFAVDLKFQRRLVWKRIAGSPAPDRRSYQRGSREA